MIRSEKEYIRLPGNYFSFKTRAKLFLGKDHILSLQSTGYTESYKRFYFKDIQAIVAQKTGDGMLWSIVHAIFTAAWILLALIIDEPVFSEGIKLDDRKHVADKGLEIAVLIAIMMY